MAPNQNHYEVMTDKLNEIFVSAKRCEDYVKKCEALLDKILSELKKKDV